MDSEQYDQWYKTSRGSWIGQCELRLILDALKPRPGESLLDVGCGTGFFTRQMAGSIRGKAVGIDINQQWLNYACRKNLQGTFYAAADARALPFKDKTFDLVMSVAALCFIPDIHNALNEIIRVTRRSFAVGLLNRHSLLWLKKGKGGGQGAYRGARWLTTDEVLALFSNLPVKNLVVKTAVFFPDGGWIEQRLERVFPPACKTGAFIMIKGDSCRGSHEN